MYMSGDYQFAQRWFGGVRYDHSERAFDSSLIDKGPSLLLTYWPSEFSQIRGQYRRTRYAEDVTSNELLFQFLFSIGAHGAHVFYHGGTRNQWYPCSHESERGRPR